MWIIAMVRHSSAVNIQPVSALWSQDVHGIPLLVFPDAAPGRFPIIAETLRHFVDEKAAGSDTPAGSVNSC